MHGSDTAVAILKDSILNDVAVYLQTEQKMGSDREMRLEMPDVNVHIFTCDLIAHSDNHVL